jgi:hypothetical protein
MRLSEIEACLTLFGGLPNLNALDEDVARGARDLLAEVRRLRLELAFRALLIHDRGQDAGGLDCDRCRQEGRRAGLLEAVQVVREYGSGHAGAGAVLVSVFEAKYGTNWLDVALRRLAGE